MPPQTDLTAHRATVYQALISGPEGVALPLGETDSLKTVEQGQVHATRYSFDRLL